ncbi:HAD-IIB family hydrolase [Lacticaseibacillus casei]|uniref:HAD-IIB family hydrolase n=1 Tax=Lacticaseibacillus casei TaxID=1582 RepID=UPI001107F61C|nr:HAD-IIB family hydrolase [Lacticaseibacillus casei]TLQ50674.1 HAD-IIB family hydrolase [Lacticaseibacillus casei]
MKFIFDVDGTLSFDGQKIDQRILMLLERLKERRHEVVFASARPIRDLIPIVGPFANDSLIGGNGSIVSQHGKITFCRTIDNDDYQYVKTLIAKEKLDYIVDGSWDYAACLSSGSPIFKQLDPGHLAHRRPLKDILQPIKIILLNLTDQQMVQLFDSLQTETSLSIVASLGEHNLDLTTRDVNKYTTAQSLFPGDYVAFGNDSNDQALLLHAKISVWIGSLLTAKRAGIDHPDQWYPASNVGVLKAIDGLLKDESFKN